MVEQESMRRGEWAILRGRKIKFSSVGALTPLIWRQRSFVAASVLDFALLITCL